MAGKTAVTDDRVRQILDTAQVDGNLLRVPQRLERPEYVAVNRVLERLGGTWNRKAQAHVFDSDTDPQAALATLTAGGDLPPDPRRAEGYVPTPPEIAEQVVREHSTVGRWGGRRVLEPSAGDGALVSAVLRAEAYGIGQRIAVTAVEPNTARAAALAGEPGVELHTTTLEAFAASYDGELFDVVVANPPFTLPGQPAAWIDHTYLAFRLLAPGGRLTTIAPAGYVFRDDTRHRAMREFVAAHDGGHAELPDDAFGRGGIRTVVVWLHKPTTRQPDLTSPPAKPRRGKPTDEERAARREQDQALRGNADALLADPDQTAALSGYLDAAVVSDRVRGYSPRNQALLYTQAAARGMSVTDVATYKEWAETGRQVRAREQALRIVAPQTNPPRINTTDSVDAERAEQGRPVRFRMAFVFDISQTDPATSPEQERS